uniref:Uncharacterized protein n=2 Tax=Davidia involucrata TaxID=16924 RepID=A0A5B6YV36_DAVIN
MIEEGIRRIDLLRWRSLIIQLIHQIQKDGRTKQIGSSLHLSNNLLSGRIPDCWMNWQSVEMINLENNNLMGNIPDSMGYLGFLQSLHLRNNNLSGNLPMSLQNCTKLTLVDLAENEFIGSIPAWIGKRISGLMLLNLRSNKFQGNIPNELCYLTSLQILDLAHNNLWGTIRRCFKIFRGMAVKQNFFGIFKYWLGSTTITRPQEKSILVTKGKEYEYSSILGLVTNMDLSKNNLSGKIPSELTSLLELQSLNLFENHFTGRIPEKIGDMRQLESLDFSVNQLFGEIPSSMSSLTFLSNLNLSCNNMTGRIPSSTQLQGFSESSFAGNCRCGPPLTENCNENVLAPNAGNEGEEDEGFKVDWFFIVSMVLGFVVGFWAVLGPLLFNMSWRIAYF